MNSYIGEHWRGQHSLPRALGLNTVAVTIILVFLLSGITSWIEENQLLSDNLTLSLLLLFWIVVLCWQAVGAFRTATKRIASFGSTANYYIVFATTLFCTLIALGSLATQYGETIDYTQRAVDAYVPIKPSYALTINQSEQMVLTGDIGHGATSSLLKLLAVSPNSTQLVLDSDGGLIAEARGLANVVKKHQLNTTVSNRCYSACTIIFIAGIERNLDANGALGFHQYYVESKSPLPWINPVAEQAKDLAYFQEKHVADWFMERAYSTPHSTIWTPSIDTLLAAGVITTKHSQARTP